MLHAGRSRGGKMVQQSLKGMSCCTNAPFYAAAGIPTVVFGPGFLEQAHTADEWLSIDQLRQATDILHEFCRTFVAKA